VRSRPHEEYEANGQRFFFLYDRYQPNILHVVLRGTTPEDAIRAYFEAEPTWNAERQRFETIGERHGVYWIRPAQYPDVVLIISCFPRADAADTSGDSSNA
jgi:hypothetical protein